MIKLRLRMNTKYIINAMHSEFIAVLRAAEQDGDTVDLCDCKFGPMCAGELRRWYSKVNFINSTDEDLNRLLQDNIDIVRNGTGEEWELLVLPDVLTEESLFEFAETLDTSKRYRIELRTNQYMLETGKTLTDNKMSECAFICLLIAQYPELELDVCTCGRILYDFIANLWTNTYKIHDTYIEFLTGGMRIIENDNGFVNTLDARIPISVYLDTHQVLPYDFGTKCLIELDDDGNLCGEWAKLIDRCFKLLQPVVYDGPKLEDYLTFKE